MTNQRILISVVAALVAALAIFVAKQVQMNTPEHES
jgi:hypothetical protein